MCALTLALTLTVVFTASAAGAQAQEGHFFGRGPGPDRAKESAQHLLAPKHKGTVMITTATHLESFQLITLTANLTFCIAQEGLCQRPSRGLIDICIDI